MALKQEIVSSKGYHHALLKFKLPFVEKQIQLSVQLFPVMKKAIGWTNRCKDGKYILFMDYDDMEFDELVEESRRLQEDFSLGDFFLISLGRPGSYHVVCCSKMPIPMLVSILNESSADQAFRNAPRYFQRNRWILRLGKKGERTLPKLETILRHYSELPESIAHRRFLAKYFDTGEEFHDPEDNQIEFVSYETGNRT